MTEIIMPKMGDAMEEGTLLEWLKREGQPVKAGEPIATIQTDKATLELEAEGSGVLAGILVGPGETVPVGQPIALLLAEGEELPNDWKAGSVGRERPAAGTSRVSESAEETATVGSGELIAAGGSMASALGGSLAPRVESGGRVKASPLARKVATELGVDLGSVAGSGPGGRIVERDVRMAAEAASPREAPVVTMKPPTVAPSAADREVPLSKIRQITANLTTQSKQTVPHFYVSVEVEVDRLLALKEQFEDEGAGRLSINDFVLKACALALGDMPIVNSSYVEGKLLQHGAVNIGMAVALENGLTLPVIHNAHEMTIRQLAERSRELAQKARENRLSPDELSGGTFSISNMGMLNVESFSAIIVPPNAAILAVSSARKVVVPNEQDELEIRTRMNLTGSFDHRVLDGAVGAKFMNVLRDYLQNPTRLLG